MAEKRMFTKKVTDDDNFTGLSSSAQALYLHLSMCADDDGFCNQVAVSMFKAHASVQDLQALLERRYLYQFDNGVIVIKHWRMANALRKDRYTPTTFQEELSMLGLKKNGSYTWRQNIENTPNELKNTTNPQVDEFGCQMVAKCLPQISIDKVSIDKSRLDKDSSLERDNTDLSNNISLKEKNTKKESRASGSPGGGVVEEFTDDADLQEAIRSFIEMRKLIKKPLTDKALSLMLKKLTKLSDNTQEQIEILNQSITGCWQGIYPLEGHEGQAQTKSAVNSTKPSAKVGNNSSGLVAGPGQPAPKKWDEKKGRYVFWDENKKKYRDRDNPYEKSMNSLYGEEGYEDIVYNDEDDIRWCYQLGHYVYRDPATGAYIDKQTGAVVTESML